MTHHIKKTIAVLVIGLITGFSSQAKTFENPNKIVIADASKVIKEHVKFPNLIMNFNQNEKINVVFTVNEQGQVNLVIANTQNLILKQAIENQFAKLTLSQLKPNNAYSIMFNFKTI
jgi:hypothetical protein